MDGSNVVGIIRILSFMNAKYYKTFVGYPPTRLLMIGHFSNVESLGRPRVDRRSVSLMRWQAKRYRDTVSIVDV